MSDTTLSADAVRWLTHGEQGISSKAIFHRLLLGETYDRWYPNYPLDPDDFKRCEKLLRQVPELRPRLSEMAAVHPVWAGLVSRWDEIAALIEEEVPGVFDEGRVNGWSRRGYELMDSIITAGRAA
jgi:hypothetical protein